MTGRKSGDACWVCGGLGATHKQCVLPNLYAGSALGGTGCQDPRQCQGPRGRGECPGRENWRQSGGPLRRVTRVWARAAARAQGAMGSLVLGAPDLGSIRLLRRAEGLGAAGSAGRIPLLCDAAVGGAVAEARLAGCAEGEQAYLGSPRGRLSLGPPVTLLPRSLGSCVLGGTHI